MKVCPGCMTGTIVVGGRPCSTCWSCLEATGLFGWSLHNPFVWGKINLRIKWCPLQLCLLGIPLPQLTSAPTRLTTAFTLSFSRFRVVVAKFLCFFANWVFCFFFLWTSHAFVCVQMNVDAPCKKGTAWGRLPAYSPLSVWNRLVFGVAVFVSQYCLRNTNYKIAMYGHHSYCHLSMTLCFSASLSL
jgi:hypothetical protein